MTKLDTAITGMTREIAQNGAYINRLERASDNLTNIATALEKSQSQFEDADYAAETTELARTQIIAKQQRQCLRRQMLLLRQCWPYSSKLRPGKVSL